jgi:hypothetical protein
MRSKSQIRKARFSAICVLTLVGIFCASAGAMQDSASATTANKPATAKKSASAPTTPKSAASSGTHSASAGKTHTTASRKHSSRKKTARVRGQQKIDPERAQAIQEALIREHYLTGTPTGEWNESSEAAMRRYQEDHGWQTVVVPDSRALIKLGLGPSKDHLLNPESAMTTVPDPPKADPAPTTSHPALPTSDPPTPAAAPASAPPQSSTSLPQNSTAPQSSTSSPQ